MQLGCISTTSLFKLQDLVEHLFVEYYVVRCSAILQEFVCAGTLVYGRLVLVTFFKFIGEDAFSSTIYF